MHGTKLVLSFRRLDIPLPVIRTCAVNEPANNKIVAFTKKVCTNLV